jgi:hypothetical protein
MFVWMMCLGTPSRGSSIFGVTASCVFEQYAQYHIQLNWGKGAFAAPHTEQPQGCSTSGQFLLLVHQICHQWCGINNVCRLVLTSVICQSRRRLALTLQPRHCARSSVQACAC